MHARKSSYDLNTSEEDELRNTFIFVNESLKAENRKLLKLARSESKKKHYKCKGYTVNGQVRVKKNDNSEAIPILCTEDLEDLKQ